MWWLIGIGAYVLSLAFLWMFIKGATARECPKPEQSVVDLPVLPEMQSETIETTMAFTPRHRSVWENEISYSRAP